MLTLPLRPFCCAALAVLLAAQSGWACGPAPWSRAQAQALGDELARVAGEPLASLRRIRGVPSLTPAPRWGQRAAPVHGDALEAQGVWVNLQSVRAVRVAYASAAVAEEQAARLLLHLSEPTSAGEALSFSAAAWPSDAPLASAEELAAADRRDTQAAQQLAAPAALILEVRGRELLLLAGSLGKDLDRVAALRTAAWGVRAQACGVQLVAAASQPTQAAGDARAFAIALRRPAGPLWTALESASEAGAHPVRTEASAPDAAAAAAVGGGAALEAAQDLVRGLRPAAAGALAGCAGCSTFCENEGLHPDHADKRRKAAGEGSF